MRRNGPVSLRTLPPPIRPRQRLLELGCQADQRRVLEEAGRQWRQRWGAASAPPMTAVTSIMRAHQILVARLNEALTPFELSYARYEALMLLFVSRHGSLPLGKMGARLQVHPASVTNLIDGLERLGYATRAAHPDDRRTTLATITPRGREVAQDATTVLNEQRFGTEPLRPRELGALTDLLRTLRAGAGDFELDDAPGGGSSHGR